MRLKTIAALALALLPACGSDKKEDPLAPCDEASFSLDNCNTASLDAFSARADAFNVQLSNVDGTLAGVTGMRVDPSGDSYLFGLKATDVQVGNGRFFLSAGLTDENGDIANRVSIVGCEATSTRQLRGFFRRCNVGFQPTEGNAVAERLERREGEAEASGVQLVSERALSIPGARASSVYLSGTTAYVVAENTGIFIFDVSNPAAPVELGVRKIADRVAEVGDQGDRWAAVAVVGDNLYVTSDVRGLLVFKLSDPFAAPAVVPAEIANARVLNALTYDPTTERLYGYSPESGGVPIYSTQGGSTTLLSNYLSGASPSTGDAPQDGALLGTRLYVAHGTAGVVLLNVSDPAAPSRVSSLPLTGASRTLTVGAFPNDKVYAFETGGLWGSRVRSLDVTNPLALAKVGELTQGTRDAVAVSRMALSGNKLYVAYSQDGLRVLDVSSPATPSQVAFYNTWRQGDPGHGLRFIEGATGVQVGTGGHIFVSDSTRGLVVLRESAAAGGQEGPAR